jgi:hypothetical protein
MKMYYFYKIVCINISITSDKEISSIALFIIFNEYVYTKSVCQRGNLSTKTSFCGIRQQTKISNKLNFNFDKIL